MIGAEVPALKRGANIRCASGAIGRIQSRCGGAGLDQFHDWCIGLGCLKCELSSRVLGTGIWAVFQLQKQQVSAALRHSESASQRVVGFSIQHANEGRGGDANFDDCSGTVRRSARQSAGDSRLGSRRYLFSGLSSACPASTFILKLISDRLR